METFCCASNTAPREQDQTCHGVNKAKQGTSGHHRMCGATQTNTPTYKRHVCWQHHYSDIRLCQRHCEHDRCRHRAAGEAAGGPSRRRTTLNGDGSADVHVGPGGVRDVSFNISRAPATPCFASHATRKVAKRSRSRCTAGDTAAGDAGVAPNFPGVSATYDATCKRHHVYWHTQ